LSRDWVIVVLRDAVPLRPIKWHALAAEAVESTLAQGELIRAGYGRDRAHLLSAHYGCTVAGSAYTGSVLLHRCDSVAGDSGSPLLLFPAGEPAIVGIHVAVVTRGGERLGAAIPSRTFDEAARRATRSN
jgi:protease YdgD